MIKLLEEIDELLTFLENTAHGEEGKRITEMRYKILTELSNSHKHGVMQGWPLLRETVMRANLAMPETEQDLQWFDEGVSVKNSGDFMERLFESLELGQPSVASEGLEEKACAKERCKCKKGVCNNYMSPLCKYRLDEGG